MPKHKHRNKRNVNQRDNMTPQTEHNISIPEYEDKDADKMPEKEFQKERLQYYSKAQNRTYRN